MPLFDRDMPGIMTRSDLEESVDLDHVQLKVHDEMHETGELIVWERSSIDEPHSIKCIIADLVVALGSDLSTRMCVVF
jgi:arginine-tRNA-protein transferase